MVGVHSNGGEFLVKTVVHQYVLLSIRPGLVFDPDICQERVGDAPTSVSHSVAPCVPEPLRNPMYPSGRTITVPVPGQLRTR